MSVLLAIYLFAAVLLTFVTEMRGVAKDVIEPECGKAVRVGWVIVLFSKDGKDSLRLW